MAKSKKPSAPQVVVQQVKPISLEEVSIVENMLPDINTNAAKRSVITEFVKNNFGEEIVSYCDIVCQNRLKDRIQKLKQSLK